jgi:hypothetical protein
MFDPARHPDFLGAILNTGARGGAGVGWGGRGRVSSLGGFGSRASRLLTEGPWLLRWPRAGAGRRAPAAVPCSPVSRMA